MRRAMVVIVCLFACAPRASAQGARRVELDLTPTAHAQIAIWMESEDGARFATIRLTEAVAYRGIGNRPGATQMNSGFRWPYGRRESVLPVWAHRRVAAGGAPFRRVIFAHRGSEGFATRTPGEQRNTDDDYFCLRYDAELGRRDSLDAVSCASRFHSNKGRYLTEGDVAAGYAEPWQRQDGTGTMRALPLASLYPPRRDVLVCADCDHPDVALYADDARRVFPEIDSVTMATPAADVPQRIVFDVPHDWANGPYVAWVEVHVEGDYDHAYGPSTEPTPSEPAEGWDVDALEWGYPYRGQPSVIFAIPFTLAPGGGQWRAREPVGHGALGGEDGAIAPIDDSIVDDPIGAPGSGADRLLVDETGNRVRVTVPGWNICEQPSPPEACGRACETVDGCAEGLFCGPDATCIGECDVFMAPATMDGLVEASPHPDVSSSHHWAHLRFRAPASARHIVQFEVRVGPQPIVDEASFLRALPAVQPSIDRVELLVRADAAEGDVFDLDFGGLTPETRYFVGVRAFDECHVPGPVGAATVTTTPIHFSTVSPCFVATAAYGSPLAPRVGALRRLRDRHLRNHALGRALVRVYETVGPVAADAIRGHETRRAIVRAALDPIVALAERLE
jgi:hypothetical protein